MKLFRIYKLAFIALAVLASKSEAGFEEGVEAFKQGNHAEAVAHFKPDAEKGYASAQFNLGVIYSRDVIGPDYEEAVRWYRMAADQGHKRATDKLAYLYRFGKGVEKDFQTAKSWLLKAAKAGNAEAQYWLADLYDDEARSFDYTPLGLRQSTKYHAEAAKWMRKAALQGHVKAQHKIGIYYYAGLGVPQDYDEAARWYRMAAEQGYGPSRSELIVLKNKGLIED